MKKGWKMKTASLAALAWFAVLAISSSLSAAEPLEIKAGELKGLMEKGKAMVIFPLSRIEYNNLHIPGSINIQLENIPGQLPPDQNQILVFYCMGPT